MEKLIFLAIVLLGSALSTYFQNKRKREEEEDLKRSAPIPRTPAGAPPIPHWPRTGRDWQEELRRVLQGKLEIPPSHQQTIPSSPARGVAPTPPPVIKTKVVLPAAKRMAERSEGDENYASPLKQSSAAYARASQLAGRVESRLQAVDAQTERHKSVASVRRAGASGATIVRRWTRNRESLREAFIASLIFAPPAGLRD